jgi:hypothetical protein
LTFRLRVVGHPRSAVFSPPGCQVMASRSGFVHAAKKVYVMY